MFRERRRFYQRSLRVDSVKLRRSHAPLRSWGQARSNDVCQMEITRVGSQSSTKGTADWFTSTVRIGPLFEAPGPARVRCASVTFEPGARTAWHTHRPFDNDQTRLTKPETMSKPEMRRTDREKTASDEQYQNSIGAKRARRSTSERLRPAAYFRSGTSNWTRLPNSSVSQC